MDVLPAQKGLLHGLVVSHMGQDPQLDLGVVRVHQHTAGGGHEHLPHPGPQLGANRDVLKVGFGGGQPPGGGDGILEAGVDASVGSDDLAQPLHIGGVELGVLPVLQDGVHDGMLSPELFQHLGVGGPAGLGLFHRGQTQLFKKDAAQLLGGVNVEALPRQVVNDLLVSLDAPLEHLAELGQGLPVHQEARLLHPGQDGTQGQLHSVVKLMHPQLLQPGRHGLPQGADEGAVAQQRPQHRRPVRQRGKGVGGQIGLLRLGIFMVEVGDAQLLQLVAAVGGGQQIGGQGGVKDKAFPFDSLLQQLGEQGFHIVGVLFDIGGKEGLQNLVVALQKVGLE